MVNVIDARLREMVDRIVPLAKSDITDTIGGGKFTLSDNFGLYVRELLPLVNIAFGDSSAEYRTILEIRDGLAVQGLSLAPTDIEEIRTRGGLIPGNTNGRDHIEEIMQRMAEELIRVYENVVGVPPTVASLDLLRSSKTRLPFSEVDINPKFQTGGGLKIIYKTLEQAVDIMEATVNAWQTYTIEWVDQPQAVTAANAPILPAGFPSPVFMSCQLKADAVDFPRNINGQLGIESSSVSPTPPLFERLSFVPFTATSNGQGLIAPPSISEPGVYTLKVEAFGFAKAVSDPFTIV